MMSSRQILTLQVILLLLASLGALKNGLALPGNASRGQLQSGVTIPWENSSAGKVYLEAKLSQNVVPTGTVFRAAVMVNITEGWHVHAHEPTLDYLIGTSLSLDLEPGFTVIDIAYPRPQMMTFDFVQDPLAVYEGPVPVFLSIQPTDSLAPGNYTIQGHVRVQACNDAVCLSPSTVEIAIPIQIVSKRTGYQAINQALFERYAFAPNS